MEEKRKDTGTPPPPASSPASKPPEVQSAEPTTSRRRGGSQKRKANAIGSGSTSTPPTTSSKRQAREKPSAVPFPPIHNGPCTRARQQPNNVAAAASPLSSIGGLKSDSDVVLPPETSGGEAAKVGELNGAREGLEALEAKIEAEYEANRSSGSNAHFVPNHAGWFSWTKIHPLEERTLPSFFNSKSEGRTSEIYMEIRNWLMKKFHADPKTKIELECLSELSVGEMDARQEVMEFLDYWGLINYHPFPQADSVAMSVDSDATNTGKRDSLVESLFHFETEQICTPIVPKTNVAAPAMPSRFFPESAISEELVKSEGPAVEYHCNSCSADCSRKRYHCQKQADFDLCTECFNNRKFGFDMSPSDFILMEPAEAGGASGGKWTDQETLLLLEALELFKENWNEIAEHVATKTKAQCILHFVQMPIEDTFLDCDDEIDTTCKENADAVPISNNTSAPKDTPQNPESKDHVDDEQPSSSAMEISRPEVVNETNGHQEMDENIVLKALREAFESVGSLPSSGDRLSFTEASNPVMALAAFLVKLVEPEVATASAHSSLKSISDNTSGELLAARHCFLLEDPPDDKNGLADSERITTETVEAESQKLADQNSNTQKDEKTDSVINCTGTSDDQINEQLKDHITEEEKMVTSSTGECADKSDSMKEPDEMTSLGEAELSLANGSEDQDLPNQQAPVSAEGSNGVTTKVDVLVSSLKEPGDGTNLAVPSLSTEAPKDENMMPDLEKKDLEQPDVSSSKAENGANIGEEEAKESKDEKSFPLETKNDLIIHRVKRAAVSALSAAAVKAKLLANQEEDQIRRLAALLIEKQLYKLEMKLAFFSEMENAVMRVKEQLDRSKQRLFHERAQIIATRLGISASSSRPASHSLPVNRAGMTLANTGPRPLMGLALPRPPISNSMIASGPAPNSFSSATLGGSSLPSSNQEKLSSVGTK